MDKRPHLDDLAAYIATYREQGGDPRKLREAVLAEFGWATGDDCAIALMNANRMRAANG